MTEKKTRGSKVRGKMAALLMLCILPLMTGCALPTVLPGGFFASDTIANLILLPIRSLLGTLSLSVVNSV